MHAGAAVAARPRLRLLRLPCPPGACRRALSPPAVEQFCSDNDLSCLDGACKSGVGCTKCASDRTLYKNTDGLQE